MEPSLNQVEGIVKDRDDRVTRRLNSGCEKSEFLPLFPLTIDALENIH